MSFDNWNRFVKETTELIQIRKNEHGMNTEHRTEKLRQNNDGLHKKEKITSKVAQT